MESVRLDATELRARQQKVRRLCEELGSSALVAFGGPFYDRPGPCAYLTNHFPPFPAVTPYRSYRSFGYAAALVPTSTKLPVVLFVDGPHRRELLYADEVRTTQDIGEAVGEAVRALGVENLAIAGLDILPAAHYERFERAVGNVVLQMADEPLWQLRMIKSSAEQCLLRAAALIADAALRAAIAAAEPGVPETHVCAVGTATALRAGADYVRYLRVHTGPWSRAGSRWPQATDRVIAEGDLVYLDVIGAYQGYQFDVLRTTVAGEPSGGQRSLLEAAYEALVEAIAVARPGRRCAELYEAIRQVARAHGREQQLAAFAGHGIGLETVEPPFITADDPTELKPGMVLCIEPKLTDPQIGGVSIEYEVIVQDDGPAEVITHLAGKQW